MLPEFKPEIERSISKKIKISPKMLTREEKTKVRAELLEKLAKLDAISRKAKEENPFWFYEPISGDIGEKERSFLLQHLEPDDIPQKVQGSLGMHLSDKKIKIVSGGNQSSKTYSTIVEDIMVATGRVPYCFDPNIKSHFRWKLPEKRYKWDKPRHVRVVGFDWENDVVKNIIPQFRRLSPREFLDGGSWDKSYVSGERTVYYRENGRLLGTVEFMSNKQDLASFGGPPRNRVHFDEEPFHEVYKENLMRMVTAEDFEVAMAFTPVNGISWTYDEFYSKWLASDPSIDYFQFVSVANPMANLDSLNEIIKGLSTYDEKKMRLLGEFISLSGLVYGNLFRRDIHVIKPFSTGCNCGMAKSHAEDCPYVNFLGYLGVDPHMVKDSCSALCFVDRENNFYVDFCYKRNADIDQFRKDHNELLAGKRIDFSVFDPSSDSSLTVFNGINIFKLCTKIPNPFTRARKGEKYQGSIAAGVQTIKSRLKINENTGKPSFFIFDRPENQELIKSMRLLQRDSYANEDVRGQKDKIQEGLHDHHACVRYILQTNIKFKPYVSQEPEPYIPDEEAILV